MSKNKKLLLIYVFTLTIFPLILSGILNVIPVITEERGLVFVNLFVYAILMLSICRLYGKEIKEDLKKEKIAGQVIKYGMGCWLVGIVTARIADLFAAETAGNQQIVDEIVVSDWILSMMIFGLFGPIVEEIIFRYIIMGKIYTYGKVRAILVSSVLFGILHMSRISMAEFLIYFISGIYLGVVYDKTKRISVCIGAHCFHNLISILLSVLLLN